jgi:hypothetical protein
MLLTHVHLSFIDTQHCYELQQCDVRGQGVHLPACAGQEGDKSSFIARNQEGDGVLKTFMYHAG